MYIYASVVKTNIKLAMNILNEKLCLLIVTEYKEAVENTIWKVPCEYDGS